MPWGNAHRRAHLYGFNDTSLASYNPRKGPWHPNILSCGVFVFWGGFLAAEVRSRRGRSRICFRLLRSTIDVHRCSTCSRCMRHIDGGIWLRWASLPPSMREKKRNWQTLDAFRAGLALGQHRFLGPGTPIGLCITWRTVAGAEGLRGYRQWRERAVPRPGLRPEPRMPRISGIQIESLWD